MIAVPDDAKGPERRLFEALNRVAEGTVLDARNIRARDGGSLEVTQQTVAFEAGRGSRTPICGPKARYPRVRDAIAEVQRSRATVVAAPDTGELAGATGPGEKTEIRELRARLKEEIRNRDRAMAKQAATLLLLQAQAVELAALRQQPVDRAARRREAEARLPSYG